MTTIYLVRHAEAEGNLYRRIQGWYNSLITDNGFRQIKALEGRFAGVPVDAVWSSDLYRTMTTARSVYVPKGLELHTHPGLREIHMGDWEDRTWGEVRQTDGAELDRFNHNDPTWRAPNGESLGDVGNRMEAAIREIAAQNPDRTVAVFSHGTAIRQFLANVKRVAPEDWRSMPHFDNTAVTCLAWDGDKFHVIFEGDNSHLDDALSTLARQSWWRKDSKTADINLWYRPLDPKTEREVYLSARRDAWITIHGTALPFDGQAYWQRAELALSQTPWGVTAAMAGDQLAGILQLNPQRFQEENAGFISFHYMVPAFRTRGLGVQLLGQAVHFYRGLGRTALRLRCAPANAIAQRFYAKHGFHKVGDEPQCGVPLEVLEKYIGYDRERAAADLPPAP